MTQAIAPIFQSTHQRPELLAPAGNWECAKAAVENGADAIYFGLERFNARMRADNFTIADLPELMTFLHRRGVKGYVTFNTLVFTEELREAEQHLREIIAAGVDAAIVQDVGLCQLIRHLSPDFPIHASTQMTITSAAGVAFARSLGCQVVVLARECSLKEIRKIQQQTQEQHIALPLEVFVHGALCVAYSGQCLTSEALGGRSANRGECAQACRMPYDLIVDGKPFDLGDRRYLLSPQDLAGLEVLPDLVKAGVCSLKIEGRLKTPEYVANVTQVYRQALDRLLDELDPLAPPNPEQRYHLEMAFSRGLYTGWFRGINHQALVHARFGKKRGVYLGEVIQVQSQAVTLRLQAPVKAGDGVVFDNGHPDRPEEGGRVYQVAQRGDTATLSFGSRAVNFNRLRVGDRVWKTSDPELDRQLRQSFAGETPRFQRPIHLEVRGSVGAPLVAIAMDGQGHRVEVASNLSLQPAQNQPLTADRLQQQLGRLGNTPFYLESLTNYLPDQVMLPLSELNQVRRQLVAKLETLRIQTNAWQLQSQACLGDLLPTPEPSAPVQPEMGVLVRSLAQLQAALETGVQTLCCELEDPRRYREAVERVDQYRNQKGSAISLFVAPPRITKPGEQWILEQVKAARADGYLVRNYDQLQFFKDDRCIGDFSLNVANPLTATYFKQTFGLERLTASYDLNVAQLAALLTACPSDWFEVTLHQHMPMFHMEHCIFCAFLSEGTDHTNCGRPCERHVVKLRDRVGTEHLLQADVGCRNTVFNGTAQTGAEYVSLLCDRGLRHVRLEFVNESPNQVIRTIQHYDRLLKGEISGPQVWQALKLQSQLGLTRGPLG